MADKNEARPEIDGHDEPWVGEPQQLYLDNEERRILRMHISEEVTRQMGRQGISASELADVVAERGYDPDSENIRFTTRDVMLEVSRMLGSDIRLGADRRLY